MSQQGLLKQTLIQLVSWMSLYFFISKLSWFDEKMEDIIIVILIAILSYLLSLFTLFYKPIHIIVLQRDFNHKEQEQLGIIIERQGNTNVISTKQLDRNIEVTLEIRRKKSLLWGLLLKGMKNFNIYIDFQLTYPAVTLTPTKMNRLCEQNEEYGFNLILNSHIEKLSKATQDYGIIEGYNYYPSFDDDDNLEYLQPKLQYLVDPKLKIDPIYHSKINRLKSNVLQWLIKADMATFTINIKQR